MGGLTLSCWAWTRERDIEVTVTRGILTIRAAECRITTSPASRQPPARIRPPSRSRGE